MINERALAHHKAWTPLVENLVELRGEDPDLGAYRSHRRIDIACKLLASARRLAGEKLADAILVAQDAVDILRCEGVDPRLLLPFRDASERSTQGFKLLVKVTLDVLDPWEEARTGRCRDCRSRLGYAPWWRACPRTGQAHG